jgi:hypothetical protein
MNLFRKLALILCVLSFSHAYAQDTTQVAIEIDAQCNIYYSTLLVDRGLSIKEWPGGAGIPPIAINVAGYRRFYLQKTDGLITNMFEGDSTIYCNANGSGKMKTWGTTTINAFKGFSGIYHLKKSMFLVGVFVSDGVVPEETPVTINFTDREERGDWTPDLNQMFYIGEGKTSKGEDIHLKIPEYANKLLIGFADGLKNYPISRNYSDNKGTIKGTIVLEKR